ncbi:universal stress protein [Streptomyces sp. RFCAC02]|uniref:universal stress protein n=1 Tax=Streptomyces sp. RFCAC02 TaxID=2499143 RepID=UPI00102256A8|nr:universal stress protein [Streptomyces sp. RFCAC02]
MSRPVIVGVDGSPQSRAAVEWAAREARRRGLPLRLVHAWVDESLYMAPVPDDSVGRQLLDDIGSDIARRYPDVAVSQELMAETATAGLVEKSGEAELLVLGSHGRTPLVGFLTGSVGLPVIAHSERPVVLVREGGDGADAEGDEVVVGMRDLGPPGDALLGLAFATAVARGAAVRAVRVWGGAPGLFGDDLPENLDQRDAHAEAGARETAALAEALAPWRLQHPDVRLVEDVRFGNAGEQLLAAASGGRAALLVVGRRTNRGLLSMRIGSVAHAALHHAEMPVAVVPYERHGD